MEGMKHLSTSLFLMTLFFYSDASVAAYKVRSFHTTCSVSESAARGWARAMAKQGAAAQARRKCRDLSFVAHRIEIRAKCEVPYSREVRGGIFGIEPHRSYALCVDCAADATFECH